MNERMPDGTVVHARVREGRDPAVLIMPDVGESIENPFYCALQHLMEQHSYAVELRGHKISHAAYSEERHLEDLQYWLSRIAREHAGCIILAKGRSATLALRHERAAHEQRTFHSVASGMVLLSPEEYEVRVQTPTVIYHCGQRPSGVVGAVRAIHAPFLGTQNKVVFLSGIKEIAGAVAKVACAERPIRFRIPPRSGAPRSSPR